MLIELFVVGYDISVIVGVADANSAVGINSYVVVSVSDVEFLITALGLDRPVYLSVFLGDGVDLKNMGDEIVIVKAVFYNLAGGIVKIGDLLYDRDLNSVLAEKGNV